MKYQDVSKALTEMSGNYQFKDPPQILVSLQDFVAKMLRNLVDFLRQFKIDFGDIADTKSVGNVMQIIIVAGMVVVLIMVVYTLSRRFKDLQKQAQLARVGLASGMEILDSKAWKLRAQEYAQNQNWKDACRAVYMSSLYLMDENSVLSFVATRTNYEYYYALSSFKKIRQPFRELVNIVERIWFGDETAEASDYDDCIKFLNEMESEISVRVAEKISG